MAVTGRELQIDGLREFRAALKLVSAATARELTKALKAAGVPVTQRAADLAPKRTGALAAGYRVSVRAPNANVVSAVPYALGAEWGSRGKWSGFLRYGGDGRFAWRAVQDREAEIAEVLTRGLEEILTIQGWAR